ncbi:MAG: hypothetical protein MUO64_14830, partial [Anaerolineales bacterium]|nr:hypothetical protein [Anaerolineales bacterium]
MRSIQSSSSASRRHNHPDALCGRWPAGHLPVVDHPGGRPAGALVTPPSDARILAVVLAQGGHKVSLIDADLRRPSIHKWFAVDNQKGLTHLIVQPMSAL